MKRIAVMTSGGDAPGMNSCLRAVVRTAVYHKIEIMGVKRGFLGLLHGEIVPLGARDVSRIIQKGGTMLQTARAPDFLEEKTQRLGVRRLNELGIDGLVVIGGGGSQCGALALHRHGAAVVGVPASIDNDIWGTNMSIGVDTALNTILEAVDKLRDTASSLSRAFLVETMGRDCGYLALMAGICGGAENVLIPEQDTPLEEIANTIEDAYLRGKTHVIIMIAEGARHKTADVVKFLQEHQSSFDIRVTILGHLQRGGRPTAFDRLLATRLGVSAVQRLLAGERGVMVGLSGREIASVPLEEVTQRRREANMDYYSMVRMLAV
jgi:6-phosphofructokinase 1